jgi:hypothetical protein
MQKTFSKKKEKIKEKIEENTTHVYINWYWLNNDFWINT